MEKSPRPTIAGTRPSPSTVVSRSALRVPHPLRRNPTRNVMPGQAATFDDQLLPPSFIADIDRIRQEWGIKGVSVTVVKQKKGDGFDQWEEQSVGLGVRDGEGNPMEADVRPCWHLCWITSR